MHSLLLSVSEQFSLHLPCVILASFWAYCRCPFDELPSACPAPKGQLLRTGWGGEQRKQHPLSNKAAHYSSQRVCVLFCFDKSVCLWSEKCYSGNIRNFWHSAKQGVSFYFLHMSLVFWWQGFPMLLKLADALLLQIGCPVLEELFKLSLQLWKPGSWAWFILVVQGCS